MDKMQSPLLVGTHGPVSLPSSACGGMAWHGAVLDTGNTLETHIAHCRPPGKHALPQRVRQDRCHCLE
jgi:hypothetical protein